MEFHHGSGTLFVADTGGGRVVRLDPTRARVSHEYDPNYDLLQTNEVMTGATVEEIVAPGILEQPSGIAIHDEVLFVSDHATSQLHAFALDGARLASLDTGLPTETLTGITVGPDDKLYFADHNTGAAYRVDPAPR